jgi:hypothetical protein
MEAEGDKVHTVLQMSVFVSCYHWQNDLSQHPQPVANFIKPKQIFYDLKENGDTSPYISELMWFKICSSCTSLYLPISPYLKTLIITWP